MIDRITAPFRRLSIKGLIAAAFVVILAMAVGATASVFVTDRLVHEALRQHDAAVQDGELERMTSTHRELERTIAFGNRVTLGTRLFTFAIGLLLAVGVYRRVGRLVADTVDYAERVAGGAIDGPFVPEAGGEVAQLAAALNRMTDSLRDNLRAREAALARMDYLLTSTPAVIYAARAGGDYGTTFISDNVRGQLGWTADDFTRNSGHWLDNLHPDDRERVLAQVALVSAEGCVTTEYRFRHRDGSWRWMHDETTLVRDAAGAPQELAGYWIDISARRELEDTLKRRDAILGAVAYGSERFLRAGMLASAADWNLAVEAVLTHLGEATGAQRAWIVENYETEAGDLAGRVLHRWAAPGTAPTSGAEAVQGLSYRDAGFGVELIRLRNKEAVQAKTRELPQPARGLCEARGILSSLVAPIEVRAGWWGCIGLEDGATERDWPETELEALRAAANLFGSAIAAHTHSETLREANRRLEEASRVKTEFLATVTHELKTPLNGILGFSELLMNEVTGPLAPEQREFARDIHGAGRQLLALVNGILEMTRFDSGKEPLRAAETDIELLLREAAAEHEAAARQRGIALEVAVTPQARRAVVDAARLRRMLGALVDNAVKFNRDGGSVHLEANVHRSMLHLAVEDSGIGIAAGDLPRLFRPFTQLDADLTRRHGGIGLGLALAQRLAESHGGDIAVESEAGRGSTFTIRLPLKRGAARG